MTTDFGIDDAANTMIVQADGKIVAAGYTKGPVNEWVNGDYDEVTALSVQGDKLVAAGTTQTDQRTGDELVRKQAIPNLAAAGLDRWR